jgi:hypothetical protein
MAGTTCLARLRQGDVFELHRLGAVLAPAGEEADVRALLDAYGTSWAAARGAQSTPAVQWVVQAEGQQRPRTWVQELGFGRALLDAAAAGSLTRCGACARWGAERCPGCGTALPTRKRKRAEGAEEPPGRCRLLPLAAALGRVPLSLSCGRGEEGLRIHGDLRPALTVVSRLVYWEPDASRATTRLLGPGASWPSEEEERPVEAEDLAREPMHVATEESEQTAEELVADLEPVTHRPSQAGALAWALAQERGVHWTTRRRFLLPCEAVADVAVELDVELTYETRGGVLALGLGAGKTLAVLGLIAAGGRARPADAREPACAARGGCNSTVLVALRTTLVLAPWSNVAEGTWENEAQKHAPRAGLCLRTVTEERQLRALTVRALRALDVLVLPHAALETWTSFQSQVGKSATPQGECPHAHRCLRFQRTVGARAAREIAHEPDAETRWSLADLTPLGVAWERVVVDDADQLLQRTSTFGNALLRYTRAERRWCLTATPRLDAAHLQYVCDFLRVAALAGTRAEWGRFVAAFFRGGSWDTSAVRVTHVSHRVRLTGLERAYYESEYARALASGRPDKLAVCVKRCAHWHDGVTGRSMSLKEACDESLRALRLLHGSLTEQLAALSHGEPYVHSVRKALTRLDARSRYVQTVFAALTVEPATSCPVCLETFGAAEERVIAPCGHIFHARCLEESPGDRCAVCRDALLLDEAGHQVGPLRFRAQMGDQHTSSKIAAVVVFLRGLAERWERGEGEGKALVIVQWTNLRTRLEDSLHAEGVPFVAHGGNVRQARDRLALVSSACPTSPAVLLATFERRLGINIQHVTSHVVLVHPCVAAGEEPLRPAEAEEQALARAVRPGQGEALPAGVSGHVRLHRFVGADTVEESLPGLVPLAWHTTETREA